MHTRLTVALVAAGGFLIRFLRLGAIENDHYVYLARAAQGDGWLRVELDVTDGPRARVLDGDGDVVFAYGG